MTDEQGDQSTSTPRQSKSSDGKTRGSFEDAVMICSHDSVWEAWLLTQSNLRNGGEHTHLVVIQCLSPAL
jgi:hypothetical protein